VKLDLQQTQNKEKELLPAHTPGKRTMCALCACAFAACMCAAVRMGVKRLCLRCQRAWWSVSTKAIYYALICKQVMNQCATLPSTGEWLVTMTPHACSSSCSEAHSCDPPTQAWLLGAHILIIALMMASKSLCIISVRLQGIAPNSTSTMM
jgi:hypothetical protein